MTTPQPPGKQQSRADDTIDLRDLVAPMDVSTIGDKIRREIQWQVRDGWTVAGWQIWLQLEGGDPFLS